MYYIEHIKKNFSFARAPVITNESFSDPNLTNKDFNNDVNFLTTIIQGYNGHESVKVQSLYEDKIKFSKWTLECKFLIWPLGAI